MDRYFFITLEWQADQAMISFPCSQVFNKISFAVPEKPFIKLLISQL